MIIFEIKSSMSSDVVVVLKEKEKEIVFFKAFFICSKKDTEHLVNKLKDNAILEEGDNLLHCKLCQ